MNRSLAAALTLLIAAPVVAQERWQKNKGACEQVFPAWRTQSIDRLRNCLMLWEMYRDVGTVSKDDKAVAQEAFDKLYIEGTERDALMALSALKRLGLRPAKLREKTRVVPEQAPAAEPVRVVEPELEPEPEPEPAPSNRAPDRRLAKTHLNNGRRYIRDGQYPEALSELLISADADPTYAAPLYLAAVCYVQFNKPKLAIEYLQKMKALNSQQARQLLHRAAKEKRFRPLRAMGSFKDLTGTAVIQLLNGGGDDGLRKVLEYKKRLDEVGMPVTAIAQDRNPRENTYIYAKPGYERQGEEMRRQLRLGLVQKRQIDWPSRFDIILVAGTPKAVEWVDDEAEKVGQEAKMKKKKAEEKKRKEKEAREAEKAKMKKQLQMLKMLQDMDNADPAAEASPEKAIDAVP